MLCNLTAADFPSVLVEQNESHDIQMRENYCNKNLMAAVTWLYWHDTYSWCERMLHDPLPSLWANSSVTENVT